MKTRRLLSLATAAGFFIAPIAVHATAALKVTSSAIGADGRISLRNSAYGADLSPAMSWTPAPGVKTYAIVLQDPDAGAPPPFIHWLIWNIPAQVRSLPEHVPSDARPVAPAGAAQGRNGFGSIGYRGPKPPSGVHHYHLIVFALDAPLSLSPGADGKALAEAMRGHVVASGEVVGTYAAPTSR